MKNTYNTFSFVVFKPLQSLIKVVNPSLEGDPYTRERFPKRQLISYSKSEILTPPLKWTTI